MTTLSDRSIIITGAGSGIGRAIAQEAAAAGAHVIVSDLNQDTANETVELIQQASGQATAVAGDVSSPEVVDQLVAAATSAGPLLGLVNNAGVMDDFAGAAETTDATWELCMRVNVTAPFMLTRAVLPHLLEAGKGSIVNMGSEAGLRGGAAGAAYTSSKHALVGLTKSTAFQYARLNVRVNAIMPGGVETNIIETDYSKLNQAGLAVMGPLHQTATRMAQPIEISALAVFLLSDAASNVSGAIIPCDAGWSAG